MSAVEVVKADGKVCIGRAPSISAAARNIVIFVPSLRATAPSISRSLCIEALNDVAVIRKYKSYRQKRGEPEVLRVVCMSNDVDAEMSFRSRDEMLQWLAKMLKTCGLSEADATKYATEISEAPSEVKPLA